MIVLLLLVVEGFILCLWSLIIIVPIIGKLLISFESFHKDVTSDIPGNPHVFDFSMISLMRTLPEPSNTNIVWTRVPLSDPLIIRGRLPPACISSFTIYGTIGSAGLPNSMDVSSSEEFQYFEIELAKFNNNNASRGDGKFKLDCNDWRYGMLAMRNYLVAPGTAMFTPEIIRKSDHKIIRASQKIISGPAHLQLQSYDCSKLSSLIVLHGIIWLANAIFFHSPDYMLTSNIFLSFLSLLVCSLLQKGLYVLGKMRLLQIVKKGHTVNTLKQMSFEAGSEGSQPSKLHQYWFMRFDIPKNRSLSITGKIHRANQKYWSVVVYDEYGIPLSQYQHHENTVKNYLSADKQEYKYDIRLTNANVSGPINEMGVTEMDVHKARGRGYVLFRLVHPNEEKLDEILDYSSPITSLM